MAFLTGTAEQTIQDAVAQAKTGDTFAFGSGTFALTNTLTITQKNITLKGMRTATSAALRTRASTSVSRRRSWCGATRCTTTWRASRSRTRSTQTSTTTCKRQHPRARRVRSAWERQSTRRSRVRLFRNTIKDNNTGNFNVTGSTAGKIPAGTGTFVMATRDVEVFQNTYTNNQSTSCAVCGPRRGDAHVGRRSGIAG